MYVAVNPWYVLVIPSLCSGRQQGTFSHTGHSYIEAKYKLNLLYCLNIGYVYWKTCRDWVKFQSLCMYLKFETFTLSVIIRVLAFNFSQFNFAVM